MVQRLRRREVEAAGVAQRRLLLEVPARTARLGASATAQAFTTWLDRVVGLAVGCPGTEMPYSTSVPMTRRTLMRQP